MTKTDWRKHLPCVEEVVCFATVIGSIVAGIWMFWD